MEVVYGMEDGLDTLSEKDIFKNLVVKDIKDLEAKEACLKNISEFTRIIPKNIFKNEWYAIYEAIVKARKFKAVLSLKHFDQIIDNNLETLLNSENVNKSDFASNIKDDYLVKEEFKNLCVSTFYDLMVAEKSYEAFELECELYVDRWMNEEYLKVQAESYKIATEGKIVKGKFIKGVKEADKYQRKAVAEIFKISEARNKVAPEIRVSPEGLADSDEMDDQAMVSGKVTRTNISEIDDTIGMLSKGDVTVVLGATGSGKTRFCVNTIHEAVLEGHSGVYFALEGHIKRTEALFIARHLAVKFNEDRIDADQIFFKSYDVKYREVVRAAKLDLFNNPKYGEFAIVPSPIYIETFEEEIEKYDDQFDVSWVAVDHTLLLQSLRGLDETTRLREFMPKAEILASSFRGKGFLLLIAHQLKNDIVEKIMEGDFKKTLLGAASSKAVMDSAVVAITVHTDDDLKNANKAKIISTKTRNSIGFGMVEAGAFMGVCYFCSLDEVGEGEY